VVEEAHRTLSRRAVAMSPPGATIEQGIGLIGLIHAD
jgi:hypothetical protein